MLAYLGLDETFDEEMLAAARDFGLRVPRSFADRMRHGDARDPLLRQVLPLAEELRPVAGYTLDPVEDRAAHEGPALLRKYDGRALVMATGLAVLWPEPAPIPAPPARPATGAPAS